MDKSGLFSFALIALAIFIAPPVLLSAINLPMIPPALAKGRSALSVPTPKVLPPQLFDMSPYDDVLQLQVREMPDYLNFQGSTLQPITRLRVACFCQTSTNRAAQAQDWQDYWYQGG